MAATDKPWEMDWSGAGGGGGAAAAAPSVPSGGSSAPSMPAAGATKPWQMDWSGANVDQRSLYAKASPAETQSGSPGSVTQEMHPEFTLADRLIVKNLADNNEAAVNYLQKQHPDLEVAVDDKSGQIIARKRDGSEPTYKVLDPNTGFFSKDFLYDAGDVLGDVAGGLGTTAASAAGGVVGGLPGAVAAGGAAGGAIETLRQALGKMAGIDQNVNPGEIALATGAGALGPALFGSGATATQVAEKSLNPFAGLAAAVRGEAAPALDEAGQAALDSQKGLLGRAVSAYQDNLAPKIGSATSGVPVKTIETIKANPGLVDKMDAQGALGYAQDAIDSIKGPVLAKSNEVGSAIGQATGQAADLAKTIESTGTLTPDQLASLSDAAKGMQPDQLFESLLVDTSKAKAPFEDLKAKYTDLALKNPTPENQAKVAEIQSVIDDHFGPQQLPADAAWNLRRDMDQLGKRFATPQGTASAIRPATSQVQKEVISAGKKAAEALNGELDRVTGLASPDGVGVGDLNKAYSQIQGDRVFLDKFAKDPAKTFRGLSNLTREGNAVTRDRLAAIDARYGTDILDRADKLSAYKHFAHAPFESLSGGGTTSTSRTIPLAAVGGWLGSMTGIPHAGYAGAALGPVLGGPRALQAYMALGRVANTAGQNLANLGVRPQALPWLLLEGQNP